MIKKIRLNSMMRISLPTYLDELIMKNGRHILSIDAKNIINDYIANTCLNILKNTAVFKDNDDSQKAFKEFILSSI